MILPFSKMPPLASCTFAEVIFDDACSTHIHIGKTVSEVLLRRVAGHDGLLAIIRLMAKLMICGSRGSIVHTEIGKVQ
jgi:hypothetical protein